jgi:hypothetical protein
MYYLCTYKPRYIPVDGTTYICNGLITATARNEHKVWFWFEQFRFIGVSKYIVIMTIIIVNISKLYRIFVDRHGINIWEENFYNIWLIVKLLMTQKTSTRATRAKMCTRHQKIFWFKTTF